MIISSIREDPYIKPKVDGDRIVGIDFGTTNTLVAFINNNDDLEVLKLDGDNILLPSVFSIINGIPIIGSEALKCSENIKSIKRLSGKTKNEINSIFPDNKDFANKFGWNFEWNDSDKKNSNDKLYSTQEDTDSNINLVINGNIVSVAQVISSIMLFIKNKIKLYIPDWSGKVVLTVPAYFDEVSKNFIKDCGEIAELNIVRLVAEPTAAAICYDLVGVTHGNYIVYDLGGGTFDVSVLQISGDTVRVLATGGDPNMGGDDIDSMLLDKIQEKYKDCNNKNNCDDLSKACAFIKKELSNKITSSYTLDNGVIISIDIEEFNSIIAEFIERSFDILKSTLEDANLTVDEIQKCILVGGSTRIHYISKGLQDIFYNKLENSIDPDLSIVKGAALHAHMLEKSTGKILMDVLPLSLGIEVYGGMIEKIIQRNSPIPISNTQQFTNCVDWQTSISISVWQGEREFLDNGLNTDGMKFLATFDIDITPKLAGMSNVDVTFTIDENGILNVTASDGDIKKDICINTKAGLSQEVIDSMIISFITNDAKDVDKIKNAKYKSNILRCIELFKSILSETFLDNTEKERISFLISECERNIAENFSNIECDIETYILSIEGKLRLLLDRKFEIILNNSK